MPPIIESRRRTGKREGDEQPEQCEDRTFDRAGPRVCTLGICAEPPHTEASTGSHH